MKLIWSISFITYQKHGLVKKAIPNIASAIKTVASLSKNENFKAECFTLVKVGLQLTNQWKWNTKNLNYVWQHDDN